MKALTFKKSVLAAAVLAVAGTATAATTPKVEYGTITAAGALNASGYVLTAKENALASATATRTAAGENVISVLSANQALSDNDLVTFNFTNGGLDANGTYKLVIADDDVDELILLSDNVFTSEASNGVITSITFRTNNASDADADANEKFYLVAAGQAAAADNGSVGGGADDSLTFSGSGLNVMLAEKANTGDAVSVAVTITPQNGTAASQGTINLARAFSGLNFAPNGKVVDTINFADEAMSLVTNGTSVDLTGLTLTAKTVGGSLANGIDFNNDGKVDATDTALTVPAGSTLLTGGTTSLSVDVTFALDKCDFITTASASSDVAIVNIDGTPRTLSTNTACTWGATGLASGATIDFDIDGETVLTETTGTVDYIVKVGSNTAFSYQLNPAVKWTSDVQKVSGESLYFPYVTALNDSSSTFTFMKIDNTGVSKDTSVVMSGTVEQFTRVDGEWVSEQFEFSNYKLATLPAGKLSSVRGDDIIDALVKPVGSAEFGFVTEALEGIDKEKLQHIAVTFEVARAETSSGAFGSVEAFQSASAGRTQINLGGQNDNLSNAVNALENTDTSGLAKTTDITRLSDLEAYLTCVQAVAAETDATPAYANAAALVSAISATSDTGATEYGLIQTQLNAANALQDTVLANIATCATTHL